MSWREGKENQISSASMSISTSAGPGVASDLAMVTARGRTITARGRTTLGQGKAL
jgi:hypothetical protein